MRIPNKSMKQSQWMQSPRVEDIIYRLHNCKIFIKLHLRQRYYQLALDTTTRQVVTFRGQRMVFGAKSLKDIFSEIAFRTSGGEPHYLNKRDEMMRKGWLEAETTWVSKKNMVPYVKERNASSEKSKLSLRLPQGRLEPSRDKGRATKECAIPENKRPSAAFLEGKAT